MKNVFRLDRGELQKPVRTPEGWMRVSGYIARAGILVYRRDGRTWREYRPPEEAFSAAALESFALVPLTNDHPPTGRLTAENTKDYQVGTVQMPERDGDKVRASILVTDAAAIADLEAGKVELSSGYRCDVEESPGTIDGQHFDGVQKNIRGNHVAIVDVGRAGPDVRIHMDGFDVEPLGCDDDDDYDAIVEEAKKRARRAYLPVAEQERLMHADGLTLEELEAQMKERTRNAYKTRGGR